SAQDQWLQGDLAANSKKCTLAFWHVPRFFSSNTPGFTSSGPIKAIWNRLYAAGADVVLNAQQHHYERFAPMNPAGLVDPAYGIKEFNVGTGGEGLATTDTVVAANSEVLAFAFGVLKLTLYADRYTWQFVPMRGETFSDVGSGTCHDAPVNRPPTAAPGGPYGAPDGTYTLNATFGDPGPLDGPWAFSIDWGDGSPATTGSVTSQASAITGAHTYPTAGSYTLRVTVTDKDGGAGSGQLTLTVSAVNSPPKAVAGGPYTGTEGTAVSFDGSGSSDPDGDALTYAWTFGDGSSGTGVRPAHAQPDNGTYTVTLTVTDARGAASSPSSTTATIANAAP